MALIDDIRLSLRIKNTAYNAEITDLIAMAKVDLSIGGVETVIDTEPLTKQAIILYCKANFGSDENAERFNKAYQALKIAMALCGDYKAVV